MGLAGDHAASDEGDVHAAFQFRDYRLNQGGHDLYEAGGDGMNGIDAVLKGLGIHNEDA